MSLLSDRDWLVKYTPDDGNLVEFHLNPPRAGRHGFGPMTSIRGIGSTGDAPATAEPMRTT